MKNEDQNKNISITNLKKSSPRLFEWFKFILGILFSGLIIYKLAISDLTFDFSKFDFNALLSLILAIFAISLSVVFYFKATDTSNLFYDNTYKFTRDISQILGRIEAGFGERLKHLDEGYSGLVEKIDNGSVEQNIKETKEEIEVEKEKLKTDIKERNEILNSLIEKSQLDKHEKLEIRKQLKDKEIEISKQNRELNFLKNRLRHENEIDIASIENLPESIHNIFLNFIKTIKNPNSLMKYSTSGLIKRYKLNIDELSKKEFVQLLNLRFINEDISFTIHGVRVLKQMIDKYDFR